MDQATLGRNAVVSSNWAWAKDLALRYARRRNFPLGRGEFTEDEVEHAAALGLIRAAASHDPARTPDFRLYASRIIQFDVVDALRQANRWRRCQRLGYTPRQERGLDVASDLTAPDRPERAALEDREYAARLLNALPPEQREAVEESWLKGRPQADVAAERGISKNSLGHALAKAKKSMRRLAERDLAENFVA